jgi:hypothetical protein
MRIFDDCRIDTIELEDELVFVVTSKSGLTNWIALVAVTVFAAVMWNSNSHAWAVAIVLFGGGSLAVNWAKGNETRLRVTSESIVADGNLQRAFTDAIRIPAKEITAIDWGTDGADGPSGLFVRRGWTNNCVLPGISREQAENIRDKIRERFPDLEKDTTPASIIHGDDSGITTLGIANRKDSREA